MELPSGTSLRELSVPLPHEDLIFLVNGHRDREAFAISRWATVENIVSLLGEAGIDFRSFRSILDFGCGCGRVLAGWEHHLHPDVKLYGVDVNPTLVEFCKANIPFARVERSRYLPPLPDFSGDPFDFVYAASVFTHLDLKAARAWAKELHRVSRPGGIVMVSFSGSWFLPELTQTSEKGLRTLEREGFFAFVHGWRWRTKGSNYYVTYMTDWFCDELFSGFQLVKTFPGITRGPNHFAGRQDISIYRRNGDSR